MARHLCCPVEQWKNYSIDKESGKQEIVRYIRQIGVARARSRKIVQSSASSASSASKKTSQFADDSSSDSDDGHSGGSSRGNNMGNVGSNSGGSAARASLLLAMRRLCHAASLFIDLKALEIVKNLQSNSNNFRSNHRNIVTESHMTAVKLEEYVALLGNENRVNSGFLEKLADYKKHGGEDVPKFDNEGIKLLNLEVVKRNMATLMAQNRKIDAKIGDIRHGLFLSLVHFVEYQRQVAYYFVYTLNKLLLKHSKINKYYSGGDDDGDNLDLKYTDFLRLAGDNHRLSIDTFTVSGKKYSVDEHILEKAQKDLLLSFDDRLSLYKEMMKSVFGMNFSVHEIFGGTVYEKEFAYFGFESVEEERSLAKSSGISTNLQNSSSFSANLAHSSGFSTNLENHFNLIKLIHHTIVSNYEKISQIESLIPFVQTQRSVVYNSAQLNIAYQANSLSKYVFAAPLEQKLPDSHQFDISSAKCVNSAFFLVDPSFFYEVAFELDQLQSVDNLDIETVLESMKNERSSVEREEVDFYSGGFNSSVTVLKNGDSSVAIGVCHSLQKVAVDLNEDLEEPLSSMFGHSENTETGTDNLELTGRFISQKYRYIHYNSRKTPFYFTYHHNVQISRQGQVKNIEFAIIELRWDGPNGKFDNQLTEIVNLEYLYEVPGLSIYKYLCCSFELTPEQEWYAKISSKKFDLHKITENRLIRSKQKRELMSTLERRRYANDRIEAQNTTEIGKNRYWNEFDDNPEEWGSPNENSGLIYVDSQASSRGLFSERVITMLINLSETLHYWHKRVKMALTGNKLPHRVSQYREDASISGINYDTDDDSASQYGSIRHVELAKNVDPETVEANRVENHDMIASFLYFVMPTLAIIIDGLSLGVLYSIVLNPNYEHSDTYFTMMIGMLVMLMLICFILTCSSIICLLSRLSAAPIHHHVWVFSTFTVVIISGLWVITEFIDI